MYTLWYRRLRVGAGMGSNSLWKQNNNKKRQVFWFHPVTLEKSQTADA